MSFLEGFSVEFFRRF